MRKIIIEGWEYGFQAIAFIKFSRRKMGYSLIDAVKIKDRILNNEKFELLIENEKLTEEIIKELKIIGVKFYVLPPVII